MQDFTQKLPLEIQQHDGRKKNGQRCGKLSQERIEFFSLATTQPPCTTKTAGICEWCSARLACAFPVSKTLEPSCPVTDTQGAGDFGELSRAVVMHADKNIVVA